MRTNGFVIFAAIGAMACLGCGEKDSSSEVIRLNKEVAPKTSELAKVKPKPAPEPVKPPEPPKDLVQPAPQTDDIVKQPVPSPPPESVPSEVEPAPRHLPESDWRPKFSAGQEDRLMLDKYGALYADLNLPDEDLDLLKNVLVKRYIAEARMSTELYGKVRTREQIQAVAKQIEERMGAFEKEINAVLGDKRFAVYQTYEASELERTHVNLFKTMIRDAPLTGDQEHNLVRAMYQERNTFRFSHDYDNQMNLDPAIYKEEVMAEHFREFAALQSKYLKRAAAILSPEQLEKFRQDQESRIGAEETRIKSVSEMYLRAAQLKAEGSETN